MLREIGYASFEEMFSHIPDEVMLKEGVNIPSGLSEQAVKARMEDIAGKNVVFRHIFRGAGAYNHYIPAIVSNVTSKEEFVTAYTPYQAEISQGILQSIFEYQTMLCELTGMDASNASIYDGATAAAEAIAMCKERKKTTAYISAAANPGVIEVMKTYCFGSNTKVVMVPEKDGVTDGAALEEMLKADPQAACFYVQQPNYYGNIEDGDALGRIVHEAGAKYIMGCNPMALAVMKTPAEYGADIAVGDGQPLGMPLAFGGPYLGFMTATAAMTRKLPGRIVGETADHEGRRAFVLTLQAREQHIRREKASSNVCSNQALCALRSLIHMSLLGPQGLTRVAENNMALARYAVERLTALKGVELLNSAPYGSEVALRLPMPAAEAVKAMTPKGVVPGYPLGKHYPGMENVLLLSCTEANNRTQIDKLAEIMGGLL